MNRDVLERGRRVLVIDDDGVTHEFHRDDADSTIVTPVDASDEVETWLVNETDFTAPADVTFPLEVSNWHHLEDTIGLTVRRELGEAYDDVLPNGINLPSIELGGHWEIDEDGRAELTHVEYDGVTYTPEK